MPRDQSLNVSQDGGSPDGTQGQSCGLGLDQWVGSHWPCRMVTESRIGILKNKEMLNVDTTVQSLSKGFLLPFRTIAMITMTFQEQQRGSAEEGKAREDAIHLPIA